jgi:hypothetical protein
MVVLAYAAEAFRRFLLKVAMEANSNKLVFHMIVILEYK